SSRHKPDDLIFFITIMKNQKILQYRRNNPRGAIGGSRNHPTKRCVFLVNSQRKTAYPIQCILKAIAPGPNCGNPALVIGIRAPTNQFAVEFARAAFYVRSPWQ